MKTRILSLCIPTLLFLTSFQNFLSAQSPYWLGDERKNELKDFVRSTDSLADYGEYERALLRYQEFFDLDCNEKPDVEKEFKMTYLSHWGEDLVEKYAPLDSIPFIEID